MQGFFIDNYNLSSEDAFNYVIHNMLEMVEREAKDVEDFKNIKSEYSFVVGSKIADAIFPNRPTRILDFDVLYESVMIFDPNSIEFIKRAAKRHSLKVELNARFGYTKMFKKEDKNMSKLGIAELRGLFLDQANVKDIIKNVIFSGPCTIVQWSDGDKTIVRCENEDFDKEKGLAMAIVKKFFGTNESKSNYNDIFKKWIPEEEEVEKVKEPVKGKVYMSVKEYANMTGMSKSTIIRQINSGKIFGAEKDETGKWRITVGEV